MEATKFGLRLTGITRVFSKSKEVQSGKKTYTITDYWFAVSEKQEDGSYRNKSINLLFPRNMEEKPNHNTTISIEAFPVLTGEGQWERVAYMVTNWAYAEMPKKDDLPF